MNMLENQKWWENKHKTSRPHTEQRPNKPLTAGEAERRASSELRKGFAQDFAKAIAKGHCTLCLALPKLALPKRQALAAEKKQNEGKHENTCACVQ